MDVGEAFKILGIESSATLDEVKQAYRDLAQIWHPDRHENNARVQAKAQEQFKQINLAYETVAQSLKRGAGQQQGRKGDRKRGQERAERRGQKEGDRQRQEQERAAYLLFLIDRNIRAFKEFTNLVNAVMREAFSYIDAQFALKLFEKEYAAIQEMVERHNLFDLIDAVSHAKQLKKGLDTYYRDCESFLINALDASRYQASRLANAHKAARQKSIDLIEKLIGTFGILASFLVGFRRCTSLANAPMSFPPTDAQIFSAFISAPLSLIFIPIIGTILTICVVVIFVRFTNRINEPKVPNHNYAGIASALEQLRSIQLTEDISLFNAI